MKKTNSLFLVLVTAIALSACSSGTTVSAEPSVLTGLFTGSFTNTPDTSSGTITLNVAESADGTSLSGNMIFESDDDSKCLFNAVVEGTISGFSVSLSAEQVKSNASGSTVTNGTLEVLLTQSNNGNNLDGTYVTTGSICSNSSGSGTMNLVRS